MAPLIASPRELIAVAHPEAGLRVRSDRLTALSDGQEVAQLQQDLSREQATLIPLFGVSEDLLEDNISNSSALFSEPALRLPLYYRVVAPDDRLEALAEQLRSRQIINSVYIKPGAELTIFDTDINEPSETDVVALSESSCDFTNDQEYLGSGEFGINAPFAWNIPGGDGSGMKIIDVEGSWCFTHSDLQDKLIGLVGGVPINDQGWRDHGTAVLGLLNADINHFGITGICPEASVGAVSIFGFPEPGFGPTFGTAAAIRLAADKLSPGNVLLLELHFPGPLAGFKNNETSAGYIPAEWWPDCLLAIKYATEVRKITVVAAAGNGSANLDDPIYDQNPPNDPFPTGWSNPLRRNPIDTGSIFVGAGAPPNGKHESALGPGRSRLAFSNFGSMVDAQGWGHEVTTTGYSPLCRIEEEFHYTRRFNGTSSAVAMLAGAVACLQGVRNADNNKPALTSKQVRQILRETGSPQTNFPGIPPHTPPRPATERIGNLPNLKEMIKKLAEF